jgi:hypothetical protein
MLSVHTRRHVPNSEDPFGYRLQIKAKKSNGLCIVAVHPAKNIILIKCPYFKWPSTMRYFKTPMW